MAFRHYTADQLLSLRKSPLVHKPDNLPAIEQWIEYVFLEQDGVRERLRIPHSEAQQQSQRDSNAGRQRQQRPGLGAGAGASAGVPGESSPMGSFSTGQRPGLMQTRSRHADDMTLGPPKTIFASSRNTAKLSDFHERTTSAGDVAAGEDADGVRSRFFADRQSNRRSTNLDKEGGEGKDSWTAIRERRTLGEHDHPRTDGRERNDRLGRQEHDVDRRNGHGDRQDTRWGPDRRQNGDRPGGWREREHQRRERDTREGHTEKDPEWMDDPVEKREKELGMAMPRTAEEFEQWKEAMKRSGNAQPEKDELETKHAGPIISPAPEASTTKVPLKLDGFDPSLFGGWGMNKSAATTPGETPPAAGKPTAKPKASRFASMFKPVEETGASAPAREPPSNSTAHTSPEEREGFDRILAMLGGTKVGSSSQAEAIPKSPPAARAAGTDGDAQKPKSRFFGTNPAELAHAPSRSTVPSVAADSKFDGPSRNMADEFGTAYGGRALDAQVGELQSHKGRIPDSATVFDSAGPFNALREQQPRPQSGRVNELSAFDPPSRRAATPDDNIANLLAQQRQKPQATSNESQALLSLLTKNSSESRPSAQRVPPGSVSGLDAGQLHQWFETQPAAAHGEPHAPKPRLPQPAGLFEEQLMRNYTAEHQPRHEPLLPMPGAPMHEIAARRISQRAPPGFFDESAFMQQQFAQQQQMRQMPQQGPPPGRRMSGHPVLPQMQMPGPGPMPPPQAYQDIGSPGGGSLPPPGFHPQMPRHPPGLNNIPNIFQAPQQQREPPPPGFSGVQPSQGGAPPGFFGAPSGMPPGFMQGPQGMLAPTGGNARGFDGYAPMR